MGIIQGIKTLYARACARKHEKFATLWPGKKHPDVAELRSHLERAGFPFVTVVVGEELTYDPLLEKVVRAFQTDLGLDVDGVVGRMTWGALEEIERPQPTRTVPLAGWVERLNSMLKPEFWSKCGYYSNQASDAENARLPNGPMRIKRGSAAQRAAATLLGYKPTHGLTCGHFAEFVATLLLLPGHHLEWLEARWCASGMNLGGTWAHRAPWLEGPRSSVTCACIDGLAEWQEKGWKPEVRGYAKRWGAGIRRVAKDEPAPPIEIIEYDSHVICFFNCTGMDGVIDPRTGLLLPKGTYRGGADGVKKRPGRPWTFRFVRPGDEADGEGHPIVNRWGIYPQPGPEVGKAVRAYLEV